MYGPGGAFFGLLALSEAHPRPQGDYFCFFPRSGVPFGTLAPSIGGQGPTMGIAFGTFFFPPKNDDTKNQYSTSTRTIFLT